MSRQGQGAVRRTANVGLKIYCETTYGKGTILPLDSTLEVDSLYLEGIVMNGKFCSFFLCFFDASPRRPPKSLAPRLSSLRAALRKGLAAKRSLRAAGHGP